MVAHRDLSGRQTPLCSPRTFVFRSLGWAVSMGLGLACLTGVAESAWLTAHTPLDSVSAASGREAPAISVAWKDTCFDASRPDQSWGGWDSVLVSAPRSIPPSSFSALIGFASPFGSGVDRIPPAATLIRARLWLKIVDVRGSFSLQIHGLPFADADWSESSANLASSQPGVAWSQGSPRLGGKSLGVFQTPSTIGWFEVPVDLVPYLEGVRRGELGGLVLLADAAVSSDPRLLRWLSKDSPPGETTQALYVEWEVPPTRPDLSSVPAVVPTHSSRGLLRLEGSNWQRVELDGAEIASEAPGSWQLVLSVGSHQLRVTNSEGVTVRTFEVRSVDVRLGSVERRPGGSLRLQWVGAEGWEYLVQSRSDPGDTWSILSRVTGSNGVLHAEYAAGLKHHCFRVVANPLGLTP